MVQVDDVKIMQHEGLVRTDLVLSSGSYRMGANGCLQKRLCNGERHITHKCVNMQCFIRQDSCSKPSKSSEQTPINKVEKAYYAGGFMHRASAF